MIAHVAEASEERGRVVVRTTSARASDIALQAAVRIAQAFQSEIESLYVEDTELIALTRFPFVREIGNRGTAARAITQDEVMQDLRCQFVGCIAGSQIWQRTHKSHCTSAPFAMSPCVRCR